MIFAHVLALAHSVANFVRKLATQTTFNSQLSCLHFSFQTDAIKFLRCCKQDPCINIKPFAYWHPLGVTAVLLTQHLKIRSKNRRRTKWRKLGEQFSHV